MRNTKIGLNEIADYIVGAAVVEFHDIVGEYDCSYDAADVIFEEILERVVNFYTFLSDEVQREIIQRVRTRLDGEATAEEDRRLCEEVMATSYDFTREPSYVLEG